MLFISFTKTKLRVSSVDDGRLHKAINVNNKMHIIEEMVLFSSSQPVQHIELDTEKVKCWEMSYRAFPWCELITSCKCIHGQFRESMSHEEPQLRAGLVFDELITCNFLSGDLQTLGVLTAGIVTLCECWHVFF